MGYGKKVQVRMAKVDEKTYLVTTPMGHITPTVGKIVLEEQTGRWELFIVGGRGLESRGTHETFDQAVQAARKEVA
jgi:hypothetical protein